jgi:BlaI family penicillinase repressor
VRDLLDRAFGGSAGKLVMQALATKRASVEELKDIRQAIDEARNDREARRDDDARD